MHNLAITLGKTVSELADTMTMTEYNRWVAFFEEREVLRKREENRARGIVDFSDPNAAAQLIAMVNQGRKD